MAKKTVYGRKKDFTFDGGGTLPLVTVVNFKADVDEEVGDQLILNYPKFFTNVKPPELVTPATAVLEEKDED